MKLAAIPYDAGQGEAVDALLRDIAVRLRQEGRRVAGAVQWNEPRSGDSRCDMVLENLATGERFDVSAAQQGDPSACRLNSYALEHVAGLIADTIKPGVDLVVLNRFGKQEAARGGFRAAIEAAITNDLPVITALNRAHTGLWQHFSGGESTYLDPAQASVETWCRTQIGS